MMKLENILPWDFWTEPWGLEGNTNFLDSENEWIIEVLVPGYKKEDLKVTIDGDLLKIKSNTDDHKETTTGKYIKRTWKQSAISEVIRLPEGFDATRVKASVENGILTVTVPKGGTKNLIEVL
jgi:HSP20 family protein